jgi:Ca2+/Na+ antiporter
MRLNPGQRSIAFTVAAAVALYVASRAAADAVAGRRQQPSAGRLAVGHWLPVAAVSVVAAMMGQSAIAFGIVFATGVACLSLGIGALAVVAPAAVAAPVAARRTWPLLVPVGLLPLMAGFHRDLHWLDVAALAMVGACVLAVWVERPERMAVVATTPVVAATKRRSLAFRAAELLMAVALAAVGAGLAVVALSTATTTSAAPPAGLLTATVLAPLVVLPILGSAAELASQGPTSASEGASTLVGVAMLAACAGLPLVMVATLARAKLLNALSIDPMALGGWAGWPRWLGATAVDAATTRPTSGVASAIVPFPLAVWRVDVVVFVALSATLVPVALGRYALSRVHGMGLIVGYAAYLVVALWVGTENA